MARAGTPKTYYQCGFKLYEQSNHLGNVLVTLTDKQRGIDAGSNGTLDYYLATVQTATHYYPFGWELVGMQYGAGYRYGFNGKEQDGETKSMDYKNRIYSPRDDRFWSVDPIAAQYPELTPYQFASNSPIAGVDLDGLEFRLSTEGTAVTIKAHFKIVRGDLTLEQATTFANGIAKQFAQTLDIYDTESNIQFKGKFYYQIVEEAPVNGYYLRLTNLNKGAGKANAIGGTNAKVGAYILVSDTKTILGKEYDEDGIFENYIYAEKTWVMEGQRRSAVHELLHLAGLFHVFDEGAGADFSQLCSVIDLYNEAKYDEQHDKTEGNSESIYQIKNNIMNSEAGGTLGSGSGKTLTLSQVRTIYFNLKKGKIGNEVSVQKQIATQNGKKLYGENYELDKDQ